MGRIVSLEDYKSKKSRKVAKVQEIENLLVDIQVDIGDTLKELVGLVTIRSKLMKMKANYSAK
ncbi:MAG: hypothetical protein AB1478_05450 [Nitrospirota bacterium]